MTDQVLLDAPYFDTTALRVELTALFREAGDNAEKARPAVLARLKELLATARQAARDGLNADGNGRRCAGGLSQFQDELIHLIYDFATTHVYRSNNPDDAERMAIVANGGYGRGLLAPGSDIDLLFVLPYKQTAWGESVVEYILMMLWDLGQKVGHATRTVEQCIKLALADMTIRTSVLDSRLLLGDKELFDELGARFASDVLSGSVTPFFEAKLAEREHRHQRSGSSRYLVEPNIKDGKGGLRDLHTLHWLAKCLGGSFATGTSMATAIFTPSEQATFRRCEGFLWTVRCHLHFLAGRAEERLSFDRQPTLAERLGYVDRRGLKGVERFMKHYFLVAKDVGDLTTILCASLEMQQLVRTRAMDALLDPLGWRLRRRIRTSSDFRIDNGRLNVSDKTAFARDPINLIRFFAFAEEADAHMHPAALRLIRQSFPLLDDKLRNDPEANRIFLNLLTGAKSPDATLRRMNEAGVLGRFVPDFGTVVSMMQFNMYHHYTVDEHLIRTVGVISEIVHGRAEEAHPLAHKLVGTIDHKRLLYVAAFLHDIAKGREEDHSIAGARIATELCPRLGLNEEETDLVAWLVLHHLDMSTVAQSRDLGDPKTIRDFADMVETPERLKLLLVLTVADIRAVGPSTWNGWKGQLLRTLYYAALPLVEGRHKQAAAAVRTEQAQVRFRSACRDQPSEQVEHFIQRQYDDYWLKTDVKRQMEHFRLATDANLSHRSFSSRTKTDAFTAVTELTVLAPNYARLLSTFAGACAASNADIVGAHITTTRDGFALDTFLLKREFDRDDDELRRARRISETMEQLLRGETRLGPILARRREAKALADAFDVAPEVTIDNDLSDQFTVIEVVGLDRPGLLFDVTAAISDLNLDITSAHITTFGERALDAFYVTDLTNNKVVSEDRKSSIRERLIEVLAVQEQTAGA